MAVIEQSLQSFGICECHSAMVANLFLDCPSQRVDLTLQASSLGHTSELPDVYIKEVSKIQSNFPYKPIQSFSFKEVSEQPYQIVQCFFHHVMSHICEDGGNNDLMCIWS